MIAVARGARVVAVDVSPAALEYAARLGASAVVDARTADPVQAITELTGGGAHVAIDALGGAATSRAAIECLRPRGRQVQVGLLVGDDAVPAIPMARVLARELEIHGSHGMAAVDYPAMLAEIADGRLDPALLVAGRITLDDLAGPDGALATMGDAPPTGTLVVTF
jgi:alcohol dehydrogenase